MSKVSGNAGHICQEFFNVFRCSLSPLIPPSFPLSLSLSPVGSTSPSPNYVPAPHPPQLLRSHYDRGDSKVHRLIIQQTLSLESIIRESLIFNSCLMSGWPVSELRFGKCCMFLQQIVKILSRTIHAHSHYIVVCTSLYDSVCILFVTAGVRECV